MLDLWKARFYYLYDKQMTSNVAHLQDKSLDFYDKYTILREKQLGESPEEKRDFAMLLVEHSHCLLAFYKYKQAKKALKRALSLLGLNLKLTGKLGRRTKFQEFDIAQLVLDLKNRQVEVIAKPGVTDEDFVTEEIKEGEVQNVKLEEESPLLEQTKITDPTGAEKVNLSVED